MRGSWLSLSAVFLSCALGVTLPALAGSPKFVTIDAPGAVRTHASGINNAGQIVGDFGVGGKVHGYLRTSEGTFTTIDAPGATATLAAWINDAGQIVGNFRDAGGKGHGYVAIPTQ